MRVLRPLVLVFAMSGCLNEYHSEAHPVTVTTIVQTSTPPPVIVTQPGIAASAPVAPPPVVDATPASTPGRIEMGPGVTMGPGIYFGGDVYVSGDLIIAGTREHPVLMTR